jgi:hypothetical protein
VDHLLSAAANQLATKRLEIAERDGLILETGLVIVPTSSDDTKNNSNDANYSGEKDKDKSSAAQNTRLVQLSRVDLCGQLNR